MPYISWLLIYSFSLLLERGNLRCARRIVGRSLGAKAAQEVVFLLGVAVAGASDRQWFAVL